MVDPSSPTDGAEAPVPDPVRDALDLLLTVGRHLERSEPARAAECLRRAALLADGLPEPGEPARQTFLLLGSVELQQGRPEEAERAFLRSLDLARAIPAGAGPAARRAVAECLNALARLRLRQARHDETFTLVRESLSLFGAEESGDSFRTEALELLGTVCAHKGQVAEALCSYQEALEARRKCEDQVGVGRNLNQLGNLHHRMGRFPEAVASYRSAHQVFTGLSDARATAAIANNLASTLLKTGELAEAEEFFQESLRRFQELGDDSRRGDLLSNLGLLAQVRGDLEQAESRYRESLRLRRERQDPAGESNSLTNLSALALVRGNPTEAALLAEQSLALLRRSGLQSTLATALACLGNAQLESGQIEAAAESAAEAIQVADRSRALDQRTEALLLRAKTMAALGRLEPARNDAEEAAHAAEELGAPDTAAYAHRVLGSILVEQGDLDGAKTVLAKATRALRGRDLSYERARVHFEEGRLLARAGAMEASAERLRRADRIFQRLGNVGWRVRTLLRLSSVAGLQDPAQAEAFRTEAHVLASEHELLGLYRAGLAIEEAPPDSGDRAAAPALIARAGREMESLGAAVLETFATGFEGPGAWLDLYHRFLQRGFGPVTARIEVEREPLHRWLTEMGAGEKVRFVRADEAASDQEPTGASLLRLRFGPGSRAYGRVVLEREDGRSFDSLERALCAAATDFVASLTVQEYERAERTGATTADPSQETGFDELVGGSPEMRRVYKLIRQAAPTDSSILILGESGTGKELVARSVHARSRRSAGPFVPINCPSIPRDLIEAELFGHERGAFTGAVAARPGKIELAQGGTLFLDEVGDMPPATQSKLLRFLQEREFERLGGRRSIRVDVRVISATSRDLAAATREGGFREDLFYRLNVVPIRVPELRCRRQDIPLLAQHLLARIQHESPGGASRISAAALERLMEHDWPGNVRELRNTLEYMCAVCDGEVLGPRHLPATLRSRPGSRPARGGPEDAAALLEGGSPQVMRAGETLESRLMEVEAALIRSALEAADWNQSLAARRLGVTENKVRSRMSLYGIRRPGSGRAPGDARNNGGQT